MPIKPIEKPSGITKLAWIYVKMEGQDTQSECVQQRNFSTFNAFASYSASVGLGLTLKLELRCSSDRFWGREKFLIVLPSCGIKKNHEKHPKLQDYMYTLITQIGNEQTPVDKYRYTWIIGCKMVDAKFILAPSGCLKLVDSRYPRGWR